MKEQPWYYYKKIQPHGNTLLIILIITTLRILGYVWCKKVFQSPKQEVAESLNRIRMSKGQKFTNLYETGPTDGQPNLITINIENAVVAMWEIETQIIGLQSEYSKKK